MKRFLSLLALPVLIALALGPVPAQATDGFSGGNDLKGWCDNMDADDIHWGLCVGSITAAHDMVMTYQEAGVQTVVCTTRDHTRGDVVQAVIDYLNENPDELDYSLGDVVLSALVEKYPCP
ncbi:MAG TPA: Rap1a/Tai family immunity protein [Magnetovibrio sp.]